jgi:MipA family protein
MRMALLVAGLGVLANASAQSATPSSASAKPQWELGFGGSAIAFPDYRGSDEYKGYLFPLPYFVWRSERVTIDNQSLRSKLFKNDVMQLNFSVHGTVPLKSKDNVARTGMPDLDPTLEIGPSINTTLWRTKDRDIHLQYKLPARYVVASDFRKAQHAGWVSNPQISADIKNIWNTGWDAGVLGGPMFQTRRHNEYLYAVRPEFATTSATTSATTNRPAYQPRGGYAGSNLIVGASKRYGRWWLAGFGRVDFLRGASFEDSPLVKSKTFGTVGVSITYIFAESATRVVTDD